jgi:hypothetical protein
LFPRKRRRKLNRKENFKMADIELMHSAKGSTWQKRNANYISRVKKNGKWVYTYATKKAGQAGRAVATGASNAVNAVSTAAGNANRSVRSAVASSRFNPDVMSTRFRKKTRKNVAKGKAKVDEILNRIRKSAKNTRAKLVSAKINREYEKKYVTNRERDEKRRKKANRKKYAAQAKSQRRSKNKIAREQAVGKVKRTVKKYTPDIKNLRSGVVDTRYRDRTVSEKAIKNNAGKRR